MDTIDKTRKRVMSLGLGAVVLSCASWSFAQPMAMVPMPVMEAQTQSTVPPRVSIDVVLSSLFVTPSQYHNTVKSWGYSGYSWAARVGIEGSFALHRNVLMGLHVGRTGATLGRSPADGASLDSQMYDVGTHVRFVGEISHGNFSAVLGAQIELGTQWTNLSLRGESESAWLFRGAASGFLGIGHRNFLATFRLGGQYANWPSAGHAAQSDFTLAAVTFGLGVEGRFQ